MQQKILLWLVLFLNFLFGASNAQEIDNQRLLKQLRITKGVEKVKIFNQLAENYKIYRPDSAMIFADSALNLAIKIGSGIEQADAQTNIGILQAKVGNYNLALKYFNQALLSYEKNKHLSGQAKVFHNIGKVYLDEKKAKEALHNFHAAEKLAIQINDIEMQAFIQVSIASWYYLNEESKEKKFETAYQKYVSALKIFEQIENTEGISLCHLNMGLIKGNNQNPSEALPLFQSALLFARKSNFRESETYASYQIAKFYLEKFADNKSFLDSADVYANLTLKIADSVKTYLTPYLKIAYALMTEIYIRKNDTLRAISKLKGYKALEVKDADMITKAALQYLDKEKRIQEQVLQKEQQIKWILSLLVLVLVAFLGYVIFSIFKQKRINKQLAIQKNVIEAYATDVTALNKTLDAQKEELKRKNKDIEDSINYAQRIQKASLPALKNIQKNLSEFFVFYQPRDIVSGDFYWCDKTEIHPIYEQIQSFPEKKSILKGFENEKVIIVISDCTGHGVPGAFMSMIGNSLLHEAVFMLNITEPSQILSYLHERMRILLKPEITGVMDGMDIAVCVIDAQNNVLHYAGAKSPLVYIEDGIYNYISGDKRCVGGEQFEKERSYNQHSITLSKDSPICFYMFSDGYIDQFGGEKRKRFMRENLKKLLLEIHHLDMPAQKEIIENTHHLWKGDEEQLDDILVMGFKI